MDTLTTMSVMPPVREAVIVDTVRTAIGKRKGTLAGWHPTDLLGFTLKHLLERNDIPCVRPNDLDDLIDDPHLAAVGFIRELEHPTEGRLRLAGIPSRWNGEKLPISRPPPRLGEHSVEVLREAGLDSAEIERLLAEGATVDGR